MMQTLRDCIGSNMTEAERKEELRVRECWWYVGLMCTGGWEPPRSVFGTEETCRPDDQQSKEAISASFRDV